MFELMILTVVGVNPIQLEVFRDLASCEKQLVATKPHYEIRMQCRQIIIEKKPDNKE